MKAIVYHKYGTPDVLELKETDKTFPDDNEDLIKVHAASINDWDWGLLHGDFINRILNGLWKPKRKILGSDIAGRVEAIGKNVKQFKPGDFNLPASPSHPFLPMPPCPAMCVGYGTCLPDKQALGFIYSNPVLSINKPAGDRGLYIAFKNG